MICRSHFALLLTYPHSAFLKLSVTRKLFQTVSFFNSSSFGWLQINRNILTLDQSGSSISRLQCNHSGQAGESSGRKMENKDVQEIAEGKAKVLLPKTVFYNPVQEFNRDLTTCIISQFAEDFLAEQTSSTGKKRHKQQKKTDGDSVSGMSPSETNGNDEGKCSAESGIRIFEGLSASGLRSIRFGLEVPHVKEVIANDFDKGAVEFIEKNIIKNDLKGRVKSSYGDASMVMYQNKDYDKRFDVIDLDPYGSASQFLDAAVQAVSDGGLLCVTCTDAAVLCGNAGETCFAKYGSLSLRAKYCHEMALRVLLHCLEAQANRYSRYIVPLVSLSVDFYVRVFVQLFTSQKQVKMSVTKTSMVYNCVGCGSFALQPMAVAIPAKGDNHKFVPGSGPPVGPTCEHCGHKHQIGGPIWSAPLHDAAFLDKMLGRVDRDQGLFKTSERMKGMLSVAREELPDVPLYYILDDVCNILHCTPPNMVQMRSALLNAGYRVSLSHAAKNSYKTNAPPAVIWDIMRWWVKDHPVSAKRLTEGSVAQAILSKEPGQEISFAPHSDANPVSRQKGLVRWQQNPERDWGPKPRARRCDGKESNDKMEAVKKSDTGSDTKLDSSPGDMAEGEKDGGDGKAAGLKRPCDQASEAEVSPKHAKSDVAS
ncbi:tRNA (guanine(26)-N(2))-dimethyltransferase-like isoform X2 [Babylonia areolata]|uniref:tRNA (guanine(26)-N(2))-dimethyltransferase-like isoform X2 n=1 Tax=Babylonia areolata TaxID=304850 RepID=UPI003FCF7D04